MDPDRQNLDLTPLAGSERLPAADVRDAGPADPQEPVELVLLLRHRAPGELGAAETDASAVEQALTALGLQVVSTDLPSRRVRVTGTLGDASAAFGATIERVTSRGPDGRDVTHRHRTGLLQLPRALDGVVLAVLGLDDRPQSRAQFRIAKASAVATSYTPPQLGQVYAFPQGTDGTGQTVAIIELGGGFAQSDLDSYFGGLGITPPRVSAVSVDGAQNQPGKDPQGADGEVLLDIEVIGSLAPGAGIDVYFAPNTDAGFLDAVSDAAHATPTPAAISISWGQSEDEWTGQARTGMDSVFADAATLGITVTAAAGDNGSSDGATDGKNHADFPASSPNVLACGGTTLHADPATGAVSEESVWNGGSGGGATGGGVSDVFPQPHWQGSAGVPGSGRGVPDVAADADPGTGYQVLVDGSRLVIGGTSAVAPLWAALVARLVQATGRPLGLLNTELYAGVSAGSPVAGLRDIVSGSNGSFSAGPGWDACTGLGVPDGTALLARLQAGAQGPAPQGPTAQGPTLQGPGAGGAP
ncbi:MAG: S53 family peptidase [Jatrophihabitantaceae bacterium]